MKIILGIVVILAAAILWLRHKANHFEDSMPPEEREQYAAFLAEEEAERAKSQEILQKLVVYRTLNGSIQPGQTLDEMIDAFAQMCKTSVGYPDNLLFETGTWDYNGEKLFCFSLVRQFQFMDEDEYVQLRLDVLYTPSARTKLLYGSKWDARVEGDFFEMVRSSRAYNAVKDTPIHKVAVRIDET